MLKRSGGEILELVRGIDVRFGSKADIGARLRDVRFTPKSGHWNSVVECPLCAKSGHASWRRKQAILQALRLDSGVIIKR